MNDFLKKILITVGVAGTITVLCVLLSMRDVEDFHSKYEGVDLTTDVEGLERTGTYTGYINEHQSVGSPKDALIDVDIFDFSTEDGEVSIVDEEVNSGAVFTDTGSVVTFGVDVPEDGMYSLYLEYLITESRGVPAERTVYINHEIPFEDARNISFSRIWTDGGPVRVDNQGNQLRPTQVEIFDWQKAFFRDDMGYITEPYLFFFTKGHNEITLEADNEPMLIRKLSLVGRSDPVTYKDYKSEVKSKGSNNTAKEFLSVVQGESSIARSESSLYAKYDRSSPTTQPNSVTNTVLNYVGGETWRKNGQWIEWEFEVPDDGFYHICIKGRQNYSRGSVSSRKVYIDGEVPFDELNEVSFDYRND